MDDSDNHMQANRTIGSIEVTSISSPISSSVDYHPNSSSTSHPHNNHHHHHHSRHDRSNVPPVPHSLRRTPMFLPSTSSSAGTTAHHLSSSLRNTNPHQHVRSSSHNNITQSTHSSSSNSNSSSHQHLQARSAGGDPNHPENSALNANMIKSGLYPVSGKRTTTSAVTRDHMC